MRNVFLITSIFALTLFQSGFSQQESKNFELLCRGNGAITSYLYFNQSDKFLIDTEIGASFETFRYKRFYFALDYFQETAMGRKPSLDPTKTDMLFDPNKGHWSFGATGRFEYTSYFFETQFHHDCFHGIDRFGYGPIPTEPTGRDSTKYWNALRFGFGSIGFLPKYRYHNEIAAPNFTWTNQFNYFLLASFFAPRGYSWQKYHGYDFTLATDLHYELFLFKRFGFDINSNNLWVIDNDHDLKHKHELKFNFTFHGNRGILAAYIGFWPYDDQLIRNRDGMGVFGLHLGF